MNVSAIPTRGSTNFLPNFTAPSIKRLNFPFGLSVVGLGYPGFTEAASGYTGFYEAGPTPPGPLRLIASKVIFLMAFTESCKAGLSFSINLSAVSEAISFTDEAF